MQQIRNLPGQQAWQRGPVELFLCDDGLYVISNDGKHQLNCCVSKTGIVFHVGAPVDLMRAVLSFTHELPPRFLADVAAGPAAFRALGPVAEADGASKDTSTALTARSLAAATVYGAKIECVLSAPSTDGDGLIIVHETPNVQGKRLAPAGRIWPRMK